MDSATITAIITCLITGLLSAGGWKFYESVLKTRAEQKKEEKMERLAYRDDLIARVDKLEAEREACMTAVTILKTDVAAMKVELTYVKRENDILKLKLESRL
jgi:outer membrane murein-binding lipoprotein Lpp